MGGGLFSTAIPPVARITIHMSIQHNLPYPPQARTDALQRTATDTELPSHITALGHTLRRRPY